MATPRVQKILDKWNKGKKSAAINGVTPEIIETIQGMDSAKEPEPDYMQMAKRHKLQHGGTLVAAMKWVEQNFPHLRRAYIKKHNPHLDI